MHVCNEERKKLKCYKRIKSFVSHLTISDHRMSTSCYEHVNANAGFLIYETQFLLVFLLCKMKIFFSRTVKLYLYVILIKHSFNYIFIFIFDVASSVHCERIDVCKRCHSSFECMTHFTFLLMEFRYYNRSSNAATYNFINKNSEREKEKKGRKKKMLWISIISMGGAMCDKYCDTDNRVNDVVLFFIVEWKHVFFRFNLLLFALNAMERKKEIAKSAFFLS